MNKFKNLLIFFYVFLLLTGMFVACAVESSNDASPVMYAVAYQTEHGTAPTPFTVKENFTLLNSHLPELVADGYTFEGWYDGRNRVYAGSYRVSKNITLVAKWTEVINEKRTENERTITYVSEHGSVPEPINVETDTLLTKKYLPKLTVDNYSFKGWICKDFGNKVIRPNQIEVIDDVTLIAKWEPIKYQISYNGAGTVNNNPDYYTVEDEIILNDSQLAGFKFLGWFDAKTGGNEVTKIEKGSSGDKTIYAHWHSLYTVSYSSEYGTVPIPITVEEGTVLMTENLPELSAEDYIFDGWYYGGEKVMAGEFKVMGTFTLFAKWKRIQLPVRISYQSNHGTVPESITVEYGTTLTAEYLPELIAEGYRFNWWSDGERNYAPGHEQVTKDVTLTAVWSVIEYNISYSGGYGANPSSYTIEDSDIILVDDQSNYYDQLFLGWFDAEKGGNKITKIKKGTTGDIILYAHWHNLYTVKYESKYSTVPDSIMLEEDVNNVLSTEQLPELTTDEGCIFAGWYIDQNYNTEIFADSYTVTDSVTLYAKWIGNSGITVEIPENNIELSLVAQKNGNTWTFTANEGFTDYVWRIDDEMQSETSNTLTIDTSSMLIGSYSVTVEAKKGGEIYSAITYINGGN